MGTYVDNTNDGEFTKRVKHCVGQLVTLHHDPMFTPNEDQTKGRMYPGFAEQCRIEHGHEAIAYIVIKKADSMVVVPLSNVHGFEVK